MREGNQLGFTSQPVNSEFCYARDDNFEYREVHKPVPGKLNEEVITTCAYCGKTL